MILAIVLLAVVHAATAVALVWLIRLVSRLPSTVRAAAREERRLSQEEIREAVASKAGQAVIAIATYQEGLYAALRAEAAAAETRARVTERRAADTQIALDAAAGLLIEVRALLADLALLPRHTSPGAPPVPSVSPPAAVTPAPPALASPPVAPRPALASGVLPCMDEVEDRESDLTQVLDARGGVLTRVPALLPPRPATSAGGSR